MFLIVGLGNPGLAYTTTRHNIGFQFIDYFCHFSGFPDFKEYLRSQITSKFVDYNNEKAKVFLQKPQTFMNLSGEAVIQSVSFYKINIDNVLVIHDDIDLAPFEVRIKKGGSNGGHNGLRSIDSAIGKDYWRIRIVVGRPKDKSQVASYVLSAFYKDEFEFIHNKLFPKLSEHILEFLFATDRLLITQNISQSLK